MRRLICALATVSLLSAACATVPAVSQQAQGTAGAATIAPSSAAEPSGSAAATGLKVTGRVILGKDTY